MGPNCSLMFVAILQEKEKIKISLLLALIGLRRPRPRTLRHFLKIPPRRGPRPRYFYQKMNSD